MFWLPKPPQKCVAKFPHSIESLVKNLCQWLQYRAKPALGGQKDPILDLIPLLVYASILNTTKLCVRTCMCVKCGVHRSQIC